MSPTTRDGLVLLCCQLERMGRHILLEPMMSDKTGKYATWQKDDGLVSAWIWIALYLILVMRLCIMRKPRGCGIPYMIYKIKSRIHPHFANSSGVCHFTDEWSYTTKLAQYYSALKSIFQRLNAHHLVCVCENQKKHRQKHMAGHFLGGRAHAYQASRDHILAYSRDPYLGKSVQ